MNTIYKRRLKVKNKQKIIFMIVFIVFFILIFLIFFRKNVANIFKTGNNNISQGTVNDILNLKSYELTSEITIKSNKNENKYLIKQTYISPSYSSQEILEPENIKGTKIIRNQNELKIENTKLNLTKIFQEYEYISGNFLDLSTFVQEYINGKSIERENENQLILEVNIQNSNNYIKNKVLYIDKNTGNPIKMEIEDNNKNIKIHILYTEVKINTL